MHDILIGIKRVKNPMSFEIPLSVENPMLVENHMSVENRRDWAARSPPLQNTMGRFQSATLDEIYLFKRT